MESAPLVGIAEAPVPRGARAFWLTAADGARLRAALFPPAGAARGSVVLSPGRTEPIEKYFEVIGELQARGFMVLAHDWRGQGLSARALPDRLKGHARGFTPFLSDLSHMLDAIAPRMPRPWIHLAHSMGAGLALLSLVQGEDRFAGAICTAPMIGLHAVRILPLAAGVIARLLTLCGLSNLSVQRYDPLGHAFEGNILTHDPVRYARYMAQLQACPDLALGAPTWGWLDYALSAQRVLARPQSAARLRLPISVLAAGDDRLVLSASARRLAHAAPDARYVEIPGALHEILMETDPIRAVFWGEFEALALRITAPSA